MDKFFGDSEEFQDNDGAATKGKKKKGKDEEEIKKIMVGFGDERTPNEKSLELLEEYMVDFLQNLINSAYKRSQRRDPNSNQLFKDDLLYFIQNDTKKYLRVGHIIKSYEKYENIIKKIDPDRIDSYKANQYNESLNE